MSPKTNKEIHVADEMNRAGVKKERSDESETVAAASPARESIRYCATISWRRVNANPLAAMIATHRVQVTHGRRSCWRRVEFDGHAKARRDLFPKFVRRRAVEIAAARFFGEALYFFDGKKLRVLFAVVLVAPVGADAERACRLRECRTRRSDNAGKRRHLSLRGHSDATSIIGFLHDGHGAPLCPSLRRA